MSLTTSLRQAGSYLFDLIFPISCVICGREETYLCQSCLDRLPRVPKQICLACGQSAPYGKTHPGCISRRAVDGSIAGLNYQDGRVSRIVRIFKYNFVSDLAGPLAQPVLAGVREQGLTGYFAQFVLVPVPLHPRRHNWRGFNQAELLAHALAGQLGIPVESGLIARQKFTKPQVKLSREERKRNLADAFAVCADVANKKILLVDDVITSGATANELAELLKRKAAAEVWVIAAAHG